MQQTQAGFTLLEILLVIVMIAVTSAMVVPSLNIMGASLEDESKRLQSTLRFAIQEAQLSGEPLRWVATEHAWYFEVLQSKGSNQGLQDLLPNSYTNNTFEEPTYAWISYEDTPLTTYNLPAPLRIQAVEKAIDFDLGVKVKTKD
ncbi:MAG: prepilin-type N-terminal cleavage/methylation domain-containing protein, partial [Ghiorsea sp.]|nr:prepilin-type N-terminal cleavage/methylation domain-containing protein [Ghiorsea sp.]